MILGINYQAHGYGRWRYCKYCYRSWRPAQRVEVVDGHLYQQPVCPACEAGLEPPTRVVLMPDMSKYRSDDVYDLEAARRALKEPGRNTSWPSGEGCTPTEVTNL